MYAQDNNTLPVWIILSPAYHRISINSYPFLVGIVLVTGLSVTGAETSQSDFVVSFVILVQYLSIHSYLTASTALLHLLCEVYHPPIPILSLAHPCHWCHPICYADIFVVAGN